MSAFPMFVELSEKRCLVVGGGEVACRKIQVLTDCGGLVTVVAPEIKEELQRNPRICLIHRPFQESDLEENWFLVIVASDDPSVNGRVTELCRKKRIPVNRADEQTEDGFFFPALIQRGDLTIGISTSGASPAAAGYFRRLIDRVLPEKCEEMLQNLKKFRERVLSTFPKKHHREALLTAAKQTFEKGEPLSEEEQLTLCRQLEQNEPVTGRVHLVGAGCGSADLITLRGLRLIQSCDALLYDELIDKALLDAAPSHAQRIPMGKRAGKESARQEDIIETMISLAREGKTVVRLKGGDPYLFGRGGEEMLALEQAGIPWDEVPGIPSAIGIPAEYGIPVTHRNISRSLHIITAHTADTDGLPKDMAQYAAIEGTLVFLMGLGKLEAIAQSLMKHGKDPATPAAVLSGGNAKKQCIRGRLDTIARLAKDAKAPAIILIGKVAGELES